MVAVDLRQPHQAGHVEDDHGRGRSSAGRANGGVGEVLLASKAFFFGEVSIVGIAQEHQQK